MATDKKPGAALHWFPMYFLNWLGSKAVSGMLPEQEGAFVRLLCIAMGDGTHEPYLEDDDDALAQQSRLGDRWPKLGAKVKAQFKPRDGKLYNTVLSRVWKEQQVKHKDAVRRGKLGGRKKLSLGLAQAEPVAEPLAQPKQDALNLRVSNNPMGAENREKAGAVAADAPRALAPRVEETPVERTPRGASGPQRMPDAAALLRIAGLKA